MSINSFRRLRTSDRNLEMIQDNIESSFRPVNESQIVPGIIVENIDLKTGQNNLVAHKLGRMPNGWIITRLNAAAHVYEGTSTELNGQSITDKFLSLLTNANCKVNLWVF